MHLTKPHSPHHTTPCPTIRDAPGGCIRMKTFEEVLCSFEDKMDLDEARELVAKIEVDKQGLINYVECEYCMGSSTSSRNHQM